MFLHLQSHSQLYNDARSRYLPSEARGAARLVMGELDRHCTVRALIQLFARAIDSVYATCGYQIDRHCCLLNPMAIDGSGSTSRYSLMLSSTVHVLSMDGRTYGHQDAR